MPKSQNTTTEIEHMARVITRCYSQDTLAIAAQELGVQVTAEVGIFRALIIAKVAVDFDDAVRIVARHLDNGGHHPDESDELVGGKIERRRMPRKNSADKQL
jgi:hypothetical protein